LVLQTVSADEKADIEYNKNTLMLGLLMQEFLPRLVFPYQTDCTLHSETKRHLGMGTAPPPIILLFLSASSMRDLNIHALAIIPIPDATYDAITIGDMVLLLHFFSSITQM
jgi:hypothetical protein